MQKIDSFLSKISVAFSSTLAYEDLMEIFNLSKEIDSDIWLAKGFSKINLVMGGGYNTDYLAPLIKVIGLSRRIVFNLEVWPYESFKSRILTNFRSDRIFKPDFFYFCSGNKYISIEDLPNELKAWLTIAKEIRFQYSADIIFNNLAVLDSRPQNEQRAIAQFNSELNARIPPSAKILDVDAMARGVGQDKWFDDRFFLLTKCITTFDHQCILANKLVSLIAAQLGLNARAVILDLDNVLWGGELGDVGWKGIELTSESEMGRGFQSFQEYLLVLKSRGILLCICSQNELSSVEEVFGSNPFMKLNLSDFAVIECDWKPKQEKVQRILEKLNFGALSIAFIDDSSFEREQIRLAFKNIFTPELPLDVRDFAKTLEMTGFFDTNQTTFEDIHRHQMKRADAERDEILASAYSYEDYLKGLKIEYEMSRFRQDDLVRINQLINKTNQFNLNKRTSTLAWLENIAQDSAYVCLSLKLKDRLGDLGLVSSLIISLSKSAIPREACIESWVLSCRAFGRNAENRILESALKILSQHKVKYLYFDYIPTEKNKLMIDVFLKLGFKKRVKENQTGSQYFSLEIL